MTPSEAHRCRRGTFPVLQFNRMLGKEPGVERLFLVYIPIPKLRRCVRSGKALRELSSDGDRAVLSPGAAKRKRQVGLPLLLIAGEEELAEIDHLVEEGLRFGSVENEASHLGVLSGEPFQLGDEVGIGKKTQIEHQICLLGDAVAVSKGEDGDGRRVARSEER